MIPKLTFLGAAGEVTGSMYLIETDRSKVVVDCGMHQGIDADKKNLDTFDFSPADIDAVILTHAHIDHSGRLPLLVKQGFKGEIWATEPTIELADVLLNDTVRLMAEEAEWKTRKNARKGLPAVKPIYGQKDVDDTLKRFHYIRYDDHTSLTPDIHVRVRDSGHIIGAAIVEIWAGDPKSATKPVRIIFSGDIGPMDTVLEKPPTVFGDADYVVIESTYGDRNHRSLEETRAEFRREMERAIKAKGKILVPTFAVDRAQRLLYELLLLQQDDTFPEMPPIFFDSPMGVRATEIYEKHVNLLSREMQEQVRAGQNPFSPKGLKQTKSVEDSRAINDIPQAIVLAGSGMCTGGRIVHHLKHNLWDSRTNVFFVGYQAQGTLGRRLVDGEKNLRIAGEDVKVEAHLHTIGGFSAHADRGDLLRWASFFRQGTAFFVTHGEPRASEALSSGLREMGYAAVAPLAGASYDLDKKEAISAVALSPVLPKATADKESVLALLSDISSELESLRDNVEVYGSYDTLRNLLESSRLILRSANSMKP